MTDARTTLQARLGKDVEALDVLTDHECIRLLDLLRAGRDRAQAELDQSLGSALDALPVLVRRPARKILFG